LFTRSQGRDVGTGEVSDQETYSVMMFITIFTKYRVNKCSGISSTVIGRLDKQKFTPLLTEVTRAQESICVPAELQKLTSI